MKLQIAYDFTNLQEALDVAQVTAPYADILEIGSALLQAEGARTIKAFKEHFHDKPLFVDAKLIDRIQHAIPFFGAMGTNYLSLLAGASNTTIKHATSLAHKSGTKMVLDLIDAVSVGQSVMDAATLDIDMILFHKINDNSRDNEIEIEDEWQNIRGNTELPIFIEAKIDRNTVLTYKKLKPQGLIIGGSITHAENPVKEAEFYKTLLRG